MILLLAILLAQTQPPNTVTKPGTASKNVINVQGNASGTPIPVTGSLSVSGAADTVGSNATFNANSVCATVSLAGQPSVGFFLASGTLAATLTPSVSEDATPSGVSCSGGNYTASKFVDVNGNTSATLVLTNPNSFQHVGVATLAGNRCARVCTTAFTSGSAVGNLVGTVATSPQPAPSADVTDRAGRLLGKVYGSDGNQLSTANTGRLQVDIITGGGSNASVVTDGAAPPASDTMVAGSVTTAAPTYTTGQSKPLSLNTAGGLRVDGSGVTQPVSGTVAATQSGTWTVQPGNTANTTAWKVDGSAVTQPVSGTVTANIGTSGSLALDATLTGGTQKAIVRGGAKGATAAADVTSTANGVDHQGLDVAVQGTVTVSGTVTTTPPSNASTNVAQFGGTNVSTGTGAGGAGIPRVTVSNDSTVGLVAGSAIIGKVGIDQTTPGTTNGVQVNAALPAGTNVIGHVITDSGSTTAVTQATASNLNAQVQGAAASGSAKSGNPVQVGGVFNTTQPTVTTGQAVEAQATARGELLIAKGVSGFSIDNAGFNVNNSPTVNQGGAPWSQNLTQINGTTILTGNGVTGAGSPRVTISSDNTPFTVNAAQSGSWTVTANAGTGTFGMNLAQVGGTAVSGANVVDAANAAFKVNCVTGCVAGGSFTDNSAFTAGATSESNVGGVYNDGLSAVTSGNGAAARITQQRAIHVNLRDASGNEITSLGGGGAGTTVFTGQQALQPYAAAQQLPTNSAKTVCVRNLPRSADVVWLGNSASVNADNGTPLYPGEENCDALTNSSAIFAFTMAGATVAVRGTN